MWILYQTALALTLAMAAPFLLLRRGGHYLETLGGRLGRHAGAAVKRPLWIHAVSVGEARVGAAFARGLPAAWPLLVTTVTPTGQQQARAMCGDRAAIAYLPFDLGFAIRRFLDRFEPRALVLVEGDYWPLLLRHVRRRGLPVVVVNGRVGDRSFRRLRRVRLLARALLGRVDHFAVQTAEDRDKLLALGVDPERLSVTGNLKFDAPQPEPIPAVETLLAAGAGRRPILVAGSTMAGEEEQVLAAFAAAGGGRAALLVLAPRHPERWPEVAELVRRRGLTLARRSQLDRGGAPADVVLLDSLGELAALYRLGAAAFVGGSLVPSGGHNPLEPAAHGVAVAAGPSMANFRHMAETFDAAAAWRRVADEAELAEFFREAIAGSGEVAAMGRRGRQLVHDHRGAAERTRGVIAPLLSAAMSGPPRETTP
ncbi:MAG: 3-deoxy-D-manno-octulosonic acid transferase [Acidobacteriota bacterium]|nr:3-deoxy-D-manno-octulosonic acid transferase [Acidobacteriota bacterium]MDH3521974.1 3-deoxy-D-manno-octulosonic acid transferase [Acidobacteriota bacterium]